MTNGGTSCCFGYKWEKYRANYDIKSESTELCNVLLKGEDGVEDGGWDLGV